MANAAGFAENLIEREIGCGSFQVLMVLFLYIFGKINTFFNLIYMSYGSYNPGWRCLDNETTLFYHNHHQKQQQLQPFAAANSTVSDNNSSSTILSNRSGDYQTDLSCDVFAACHQVEFNPESSTIVTEWGLVCDQAWIPSFIISIQMAGNLVGFLFSGWVIDFVGRKKSLYGSVLANTVIVICSVFSPSWHFFAAFRFLIGVTYSFYACLQYAYCSEFMTQKWRGPLVGVPGWSLAGLLFALTAMLLKDWRHVLAATAVFGCLSMVPSFWVPESLRWLEVKTKTKEFRYVAEKMAKSNGKTLECFDEDSPDFEDWTTKLKKPDAKRYSWLDLFRPGYRLRSVLIPFVFSLTILNFYAISFGVKALSGDFYINLMLLYAIMLACSPLPFYSPNLLGRKRGSLVFLLLAALCLFAAACFETFAHGSTRTTGALVAVLFAQVCVDTTVCVLQVLINELYPTVARGLAMAWVQLFARISGILAPFIIAKDAQSVQVWYIVMGCVGVVSCCALLKLPETKSKPLKETFEETTKRDAAQSENFIEESPLPNNDMPEENRGQGRAENDDEQKMSIV